ncbi:MAG: response regulator [Verrucomicrobiota bacterium]
MKILIADDNAVERMVLANAVRKSGFEVVTVSDGQEAWDHLQQPDAAQIALLDWMMPVLSGPELCRRLRAREVERTLYLLLVTGRNAQKDIVDGLASGADDFIGKPWNPAELRARIEVGCRMVELQNRLRDNVARLSESLAETRRLIHEQHLNIDLARKLLGLANSGVPRWIGLNEELTLHVAAFSASCARAGGDHYWARTRPVPGRGPVTTLGIRDQSGHEVNCILRSIASDLLNMRALEQRAGLEEQLACVNDALCSSGMFAGDEFVTALTAELEHATLRLRYVSCGHPPFLLIRGATVMALPAPDGPGTNVPLGSLPGQVFTAGECVLVPGDRLLFYTDGLSEARRRGESGGSLSNEELRQLAAFIVAGDPAIPVSRLVRHWVSAAAQNPAILSRPEGLYDDVTVLGLEIEEDSAGAEAEFHFAEASDIDEASRGLCEGMLSRCPGASGEELRQVLDEALTNAWLHGNRRRSDLPVRVRWGIHNGLFLQIEDAGPGFNPGDNVDPLCAEGLLREHGRGVFMIRNACDWVEWKKGGARLVARLAGSEK